MREAIINGRRVSVPDSPTAQELRDVGGVDSSRRLLARTREGTYVVPENSRVDLAEVDNFVDSPRRTKG